MDTAYVLALDTTDAEELVVEAQELLEKAKNFCLHSQNYIVGNEFAFEAQNLLEKAKKCLNLQSVSFSFFSCFALVLQIQHMNRDEAPT